MSDELLSNFAGELQDAIHRGRRFNALVAHIFDEYQKIEDDPSRSEEAALLKEILEFARGTRPNAD